MLNPTFARYKQAADELAERNGYIINVFETAGIPNAFGFKVYKQNETVPISMWTVTVRRNPEGVAVIESSDYLSKPGFHIPGAKMYEFLALLDMLDEKEEEESN